MNLLRQSISFFYLLAFLLIMPALGYTNPLGKSPIVINADRFEYIGDQISGKMIARGNVEAVQDNQKLNANLLEYDFKKDTILAQDHVKLLEKDGYIIEADKVILSDRMKFGSVNHFTVLLPNKSTLKGEFAKKDNEAITNIEKGYYTACQICPGKKPIWAITAKSTELNEATNSISYRHAVVSFYGLPTIYTPYFQHYTSKAQRKSGFLVPEYGGSSYLGTAVKIPYYFNISPNQDATLKMIATKKRGQAFEGEHRYLLPQGQIDSSGSIASAREYSPPQGQSKPKHNIRYHLNSKTELALTDRQNIGWDVKTSSDKSYRRDYGYGGEDFLTSRLYNHSYQKNGFYEVQTMAFQNLRPDTDNEIHKMNQTPMVMPLFESKHQIFKFDDNSSLNFETSLLKIHRYNGPDSNRISIKNKWQKNILLDSGHDFKVFGSLRNDIYHYEKAPINNNPEYTGTVSRAIPEAGVDWSYPLTRNFGSTNVVVAPIASAIVTSYSKYNHKIYSEDSSNLSELTDGNLFAPSQYTGIDLVENTPRVGYGVKSIAYYKDYLNASALFGQMYRQRPRDYITGAPEDRLSDYVGRFKFDVNDTVIFSYRYKLDKDSLLNKTNEAEALLKYKKAYILTDILYYRDNQEINKVTNRREVYLETGVNDYNNVSASINARKNLSSKKDNPDLYIDPNGFISVGGRLKYLNDCILYTASINRDYTRSKDKKPSTSYWFTVSFKNIS